MEQKITIEKQKELKNESMFNFKNVSLMKKQLFSLMMAFALVVGLSVGALAQNDGWSIGTAIWHVPGSSYTIGVDNHDDFSYAWAVTAVSCDGVTFTATTTASVTDGANTSTLAYTNEATGLYRITVTETDGDGGCATVREFFTAIMDINLIVVASDDEGNAITADALLSCNDYSIVGPNKDNAEPNLVPNDDDEDNGDNLSTWDDAPYVNTRWVNVSIEVSEESGCPAGTVANQPTADQYSWQFDYTIAGTNYVDGTNDNFIQMLDATNVVGGLAEDVDLGTVTAATGSIVVDAGVTSFTIPLESYIRWGTENTNQDQIFTFAAANVALSSDGTNFTDGGESADNATDQNKSLDQTIHASPATSRISVQ